MNQLARARWALMFGNFSIGCGVMVVAGSLNDITRSLNISVALAGQLISVGAVMMCFGAPLVAAFVGGWDRRRLLAWSLVWYAVGHAICAFMPNFAMLLPLRAVSVIAAAVYTPQAAAAMGFVAPPEERGRSIIFIFLGWSVASVVGMPVHSYIGEALGWRWAFGLVTVLSLGAAWWVWAAVPDGVKPPSMNISAWRDVFTHPVLMAIVMVTAIQGAGQFSLFSYFAPYFRQVLGASAAETSLLFFWFGAFGLLGNLLLSRYVDRIGPASVVALALCSILASLLLWPWGSSFVTMALVVLPWGLGCFAANSAQQARLGQAAPELGTALMALNTSAIYLGQAIGAASGGAVVAAYAALGGNDSATTYDSLHWIAIGWMLGALALSLWAQRKLAATHGRI